MRLFVTCFVCSAVILLAAGYSALHATWYYDGIAVCDHYADQAGAVGVPDGSGGAIIFWEDYRFTTKDVFVQRIDSNGVRLWSTDGEEICTATDAQIEIDAAADGAGGAFVVWRDFRGGDYDIYAQKVDASGNGLWAADGIPIATAPYDQANPRIIADGEGGAIITWQSPTLTITSVYAQKIDPGGGIKWAAGGVLVCGGLFDSYDPRPVSDGQGGAIITWWGYPGADADIRAQRIADTGVILWAAGGISICGLAEDQYYPRIVPDGMNGGVIVWRDDRDADYDIYAQRVDPGGNVQWTMDGVSVCTAAGVQQYHRSVSDGHGGVIVAWEDKKSGGIADIYAQRIDGTGTTRWNVNGVAVCVETNSQFDPALAEDDAGGAIITWGDYRYLQTDLYAQKVDSVGVVQWKEGGIPVCTAAGYRTGHDITSNGSGGAFVFWLELLDTHYDVYAARISKDGRYGCEPDIIGISDVPDDQGGWVNIRISASTHDGEYVDHLPVTGYNVWKKASGSVSAAACMIGSDPMPKEAIALGLPPGDWISIGFHAATQDSIYDLLVPTDNDSTSSGIPWETYLVTAHTTAPRTFFETYPDSGYSVDNLAPGAPFGLGGEFVSAPPGITLDWERNAEQDLWYYAIYRGENEEFAPGPGNLIGTTTGTSYTDEFDMWHGSYYKVSAIDRHENESPFALLGPDDMAGEETPDVSVVTHLAQNFPNPFNPVTMIAFGLHEPAHVTLKIYDAAGRLVRVLVDEHRTASRYEVAWDGRDTAGRPAASGVYFYKLDAGAFEATKKMVLLR